MTSNSEKNLPDAFLRRCAFYHIDFPDKTKLTNIVKKHLPDIKGDQDKLLEELIEKFEKIRNASPRKKPATAELLNWIGLLSLRNYFDPYTTPEQRKELLKWNLSFLLKTKEDMEAIQRLGIDKL